MRNKYYNILFLKSVTINTDLTSLSFILSYIVTTESSMDTYFTQIERIYFLLTQLSATT